MVEKSVWRWRVDILRDAGFRERAVTRTRKLVEAEISSIRSANCQQNAQAHFDAIWGILEAALRLTLLPHIEKRDILELRSQLTPCVGPMFMLGMFHEAGELTARHVTSILP
ncbi:MAG: hypothetical protein IT406_03685 [Candidatus Yanofskybacteria bacterium]|nr:hypothetical protein [Candidatus Yanofskybacteria bacterium]